MPDSFWAFDCYSYPGDSAVAWLWAHGFRISGLYLNHRRGAGGEDQSWISKRSALANAGWGLIPLYLGWQTVGSGGGVLSPPSDPAGSAAADAAEALALLHQAQLPPGSTVYFDIESGTVPAGVYQTYLLAWRDAVKAGGFYPGAYCSHLCATWAIAKGFPVWSFHIPFNGGPAVNPASLPTDAIDNGCLGTQIRQNVYITGLPLKIDLSRFSIPDPSCPSGVSQAIS